MRSSLFRLFLAVAAICLGLAPCLAGEPLPSVESVLAKWEAASRKCRTLDAKLTTFDGGGGRSGMESIVQQGRFYYEAPNMGYFKIEGNGHADSGEFIVWKGEETLAIRPDMRRCERCFVAIIDKDLSIVKQRWSPDAGRPGWLGRLGEMLAASVIPLRGPQEFLPLTVGIRASEVRERFDVTIRHSGEQILLSAVPKRFPENDLYRGIDVILNSKTYLTYAVRRHFPDGAWVVWVLDDQKINQWPKDRDKLMNPDLSGFAVSDVPRPLNLVIGTDPDQDDKR